MSTVPQVLANRRNAEKSTGPRTAEGKSVASENSLKHGLSARQLVIRSEDQAEFDLHRRRMLAELVPVGPVESMLAERIVSLSWRLNRAVHFQNQAVDAMTTPDTSSPLARLTQSLLPKAVTPPQADPSGGNGDLVLGRMAVKDFANARVLEHLLMYERRIEHSLYRTMLELQRLRLLRQLDPMDEPTMRPPLPAKQLNYAKRTQFAEGPNDH